MAGLVPAIHASDALKTESSRLPGRKCYATRRCGLVICGGAAWMAGTSPAMTAASANQQATL
jgi:hypothetical protein